MEFVQKSSIRKHGVDLNEVIVSLPTVAVVCPKCKESSQVDDFTPRDSSTEFEPTYGTILAETQQTCAHCKHCFEVILML